MKQIVYMTIASLVNLKISPGYPKQKSFFVNQIKFDDITKDIK